MLVRGSETAVCVVACGLEFERAPKLIGGLCVLVWEGLMLLVLSRRTANLLPGMVAALVGNIVVLLAWFGVALDGPRRIDR